ncbi:MAG TPA: fumarylacetoacetate hydrolase family protein [Candidatus Acidoferrum sp.]|nr:fumarylacetoacetate hydrolase family protein [Candidatus Acidoferrum sp.]
MKLVTYKAGEQPERFGVLTEQGVVDLQEAARTAGAATDIFTCMMSFLKAGVSAQQQARQLLAHPQGKVLPLSSVRLRAPVPRPGKIIAVGLNYRDHAMESGAAQPPKVPILFAKFPNSISGPEDPIVIPGDPHVDWEAELAVVIGREGKAIPAAKSGEYIAGYMPLNDVSAREWQFGDKQWVRGKSPDTFCPTGPHLTTPDEIRDVHALHICSRVNGAVMQDSSTSKLIFRVPELIEFISAAITLEPGDIIATGTPEGVGAFRKPPIYLRPGDTVEIEIERLGVLRNPVVAH